MDGETLPSGWSVWNDEPKRCILVFRPDVFDGDEFPAPCLPTIYLSHGRKDRGPERASHRRADDPDWYVTLTMEPDVSATPRQFDSRADAEAGAAELAAEFVNGTFEYRDLYQVDRPAYLDRLDELTGRET
jgi:hypothetical protein